MNSVYVHPLSQIVLQYLQLECHEWICARQLDGNLRLHRDGTFVLESTTQEDAPTTFAVEATNAQTNTNDAATTSSAFASSSTTTTRIWTYYDLADKKQSNSVL